MILGDVFKFILGLFLINNNYASIAGGAIAAKLCSKCLAPAAWSGYYLFSLQK